MNPKKIYISGKITGCEPGEAEAHFEAAEQFLKKQYPNAILVNPFFIQHNHNKSWENYMRTDLIAMLDCDTIYMLNNWKDSKGARIEYLLAFELNFNILFEHFK